MNPSKTNYSKPKIYLNPQQDNRGNQNSYNISYLDEKIRSDLNLILEKQAVLEQSLIKFHQVINNLMLNTKHSTNLLSSHLKMLQNTMIELMNKPIQNEEFLKLMRKTVPSKNIKKIYVNGSPIEVSAVLDFHERKNSVTFLTPDNHTLVVDITQINGFEIQQ
ncbi:hypothetical protein [Ureibacillus chungkukjangi]|uniref:Uncharacterized protein n=1 Tax=Ureibacillus chungkukjangi TaxID=1202712 RepID=A0A318U3D5_9BACL|nr:hypothetical protein [Ureibacillus chungkukjangi]PYF08895.1 hypothetical protein BJ095_101116 [Ureibacillus chungkukjangi]